MPEVVPHRVGSLFSHRDTRLTETEHPVVVKSVDMSDLGPSFRRYQIRFDYGFGGDQRLYVEVSVYKPHPGAHGLHHCFDVQALVDGARPDGLRSLAKRLCVPPDQIIEHIVDHASWFN